MDKLFYYGDMTAISPQTGSNLIFPVLACSKLLSICTNSCSSQPGCIRAPSLQNSRHISVVVQKFVASVREITGIYYINAGKNTYPTQCRGGSNPK
ncbi:unnamed protein product [Hermetia illucens]|uniref:Uncharacterized protein n=1 Tax=Hermetia illucens TaxID=343691 RepID=A0A7R8V3I7_HERIL|nr:unnamed protein product [Hermetia illucens]